MDTGLLPHLGYRVESCIEHKSAKKSFKWTTGTRKGAEHQQSSEKCNWKPQWDIAHMLGSLLFKKSKYNECWQGCGEIGTLVHCWWACKMVQQLWKEYGGFFQLKIELPYDPAISVLSTYPKGLQSESWFLISGSRSVCDKALLCPIVKAVVMSAASAGHDFSQVETWESL